MARLGKTRLKLRQRPRVSTLIEAVGAKPLYLPPYSPDLNSIEKLFAKLKALQVVALNSSGNVYATRTDQARQGKPGRFCAVVAAEAMQFVELKVWPLRSEIWGHFPGYWVSLALFPTEQQSAYSERRVRTRIPGLSSGVPMNSMPAASSAVFSSTNVEVRLCGIPSKDSNLLIVRTPKPDLSASSSMVQRSAALAERICVPVTIDNSRKGP
jgi:hypothetical protein